MCESDGGFGGGGRLHIFEDLSRNELYLHCDECEWGWRNPEEASSPDAAFMTVTEEFEARLADWNTIQRYGWEKYARRFYNK